MNRQANHRLMCVCLFMSLSTVRKMVNSREKSQAELPVKSIRLIDFYIWSEPMPVSHLIRPGFQSQMTLPFCINMFKIFSRFCTFDRINRVADSYGNFPYMIDKCSVFNFVELLWFM